MPRLGVSDTPPDLNASVWAFPVVGLVTGLVGAGVYAIVIGVGLPVTLAAIFIQLPVKYKTPNTNSIAG